MNIKNTLEDRNSFDQAFYSLADDWAMYEISQGLIENVVYYVLGTWFHDESQIHLDLEHCYKMEWKVKLEEALDSFKSLQKEKE